jgi:quercetin dioxygenase-like cupin family protein
MMECPLQEHIWQVDHIFTEYPSLYEYICISRALRFMRQVVQNRNKILLNRNSKNKKQVVMKKQTFINLVGQSLTKKAIGLSLGMVLVLAVSGVQAQQVSQRSGVTSKDLIVQTVENTDNLEFTVIEVEYEPGGINPRHSHPAALTFYIISGTPVFQEEGKEPITLKPGESLFVPAGTIHSHWNPSKTEGVRWLEFIAAEKGKGRAIRLPE